MAIYYSYLKYKDVHTLKNDSGSTISYEVNTVNCETTTLYKTGTILPQQTITLDFLVDGTYSARVFTSTENARPFIVKVYNNLLLSFLSMADQILCNCGKCQDCEECNDCQDYLSVYTKAQAFESINYPLYEDYINQITQDSICLYTKETLYTLLKEKVYGTAETKKMLFQFISFYYLGFYYQDLSDALDASEVTYINTKYKFDKVASCIKSIGIFPRNPIDIPPFPEPVEVPNAPVVNANGPYCLNDTPNQLSAIATSGNTLRWYTVPVGGAFSTNAPIPNTSVVGITSYYVSQINSLLYESTRSFLPVQVNPELPAYVILSSTSASACSGSSTTFTATPINGGSAPTYQWYKNGAVITGQTAATYTAVSSTTGDSIYVVMTSNASPCLIGSPATSNIITLVGTTVTPTVAITSTASSICTNASVTFSILNSSNMGTNPTYQWKKNGVNINGATGSTYTSNALTTGSSITLTMISSLDAGCLTVTTVTSNARVITVNPPTAITTAPVAVNVCANQPASFTVVATGSSLTYQWYKNGVLITGATSATYSIASATSTSAGSYSVVVNGACGSVSSPGVALTIKPATTISVQPTNITQPAGSTVTFSVTAQNATGYQWRLAGSNIPGATNSTLTITNIQSANEGTYTVVVTGECNSVTFSNAVLSLSSNNNGSGGPSTIRLSQASSGCPAPVNTYPYSVTASTTSIIVNLTVLSGGLPPAGPLYYTSPNFGLRFNESGLVIEINDCLAGSE